MVPGRRYTPGYILAVLRRRWLLIAVPLLVIGTLALLLARALPDVYYAEGTVVIIPQQIPETYVRTTVTLPLGERLRRTAEEIKSPANLAPLIQEFNLYPNLRATVSLEALAAWMAHNTRIELTRPDTILVGYSGFDSTLVAPVAARLLQQVIDGSLQDRRELVDNTSKFLDAELEAARNRLVEQERKVQAFRERYAGQLPTEVPANLQILQGWQSQLQGVMEELRQDRSRRAQVQELLSGGERAPEVAETQGPESTAVPSSALPAEPATDASARAPSDPAAQQLAAARAGLKDLLTRYRPQHPDVLRLQATIAELEREVPTIAAVGESAREASTPSPRALRRQAAQAELQKLDARIEEREGLERRLRDGIATYQARIAAVPSREADWVALTRDYQTLQQSYSSMLAKKEESRLAANLESRQIGEQFRSGTAPAAPTKPVSPDRPGIVFVGLLLGLVCGLAMPILLELTDSKLRGEQEVVTALRLPVLAMLPRVATTRERPRSYIRGRRLGFAALIISAVAAVWRLR